MKIVTLKAWDTNELDKLINKYLQSGYTLIGDMQVYKEERNHAVTGEELWENMFAQRVSKVEQSKGGK